jgi:hypothetical protein
MPDPVNRPRTLFTQAPPKHGQEGVRVLRPGLNMIYVRRAPGTLCLGVEAPWAQQTTRVTTTRLTASRDPDAQRAEQPSAIL